MKRKNNAFEYLMKRSKQDPLFDKPLTLAYDIDKVGYDKVIGWYMSEKLDGVRALWNGLSLVSRNYNKFKCRQSYYKHLPLDIALDGELFNADFNTTISQVKLGIWDNNMRFYVFDSPSLSGTYIDRYKCLLDRFSDNPFIIVLKQTTIETKQQILDMLEKVTSRGGEGLIVRDSKMNYISSRTKSLLKVKKMKDDECTLIGFTRGKGRHSSRIGAFECLYRGKKFNLGTGLSDSQRENECLPKIGDTITFKYFELTANGIPRFPVFKSIRLDY